MAIRIMVAHDLGTKELYTTTNKLIEVGTAAVNRECILPAIII